MSRTTSLRIAVPVAFAMFGISPSPAPAAGQAPFYQGKTVSLVVSSGVGGGTDTTSRLIAPFLARHLPGRPAVVVQNMPGAGGLQATNYLYSLAPKDGSTIGMLDESVEQAQLFGTRGLRADVRRFNWIGRMMSNDAVLIVRAGAPVKTIQDAFHHQLIVSASGLSSLMRWTVLKRLTGIKFKLIVGHRGSAGALLAMERGEVDALSMPWPVLRAQHADLLRDKKVRILLQTALDKAPDLPNVPRLADLGRNKEERQILELLSQPSRVGRSLVAPPDTPADRVAELRAAFTATFADPKFLSQSKVAKLDLDPLSGARLQKLIDASFDYPAALVDKAKALAKLN